MNAKILITIFLFCIGSTSLMATHQFSVQTNLNYTGFEQQVKAGVGKQKGPLLTDTRSFSLQLQGNYHHSSKFYIGVFTRFDQGARILGNYTKIQSDGLPEINPRIGGNFHEFWIGPTIGYQLKYASAELGYGIIGLRKDTARDDIKPAGTDGEYLSTSATVAWQFALSVFCLLYTSPSPRDKRQSRMPSSA